MRDTSLLQLALGIAPPWTVTGSEFDAAARRLDIRIDFTAGSRFACPSCGTADCPVHDTEPMRRGAVQTSSSTRLFSACPVCHACAAPDAGSGRSACRRARAGGGFTLLFEALIMALVTAMPVNAVARLVGEHNTRLWRVIHHYVERARAHTDLSAVTRVAIDDPASSMRP